MPLVIAKSVLPDAQKFYLALGRIFGIGRAQGLAIAEEVGISKEARVADVKAEHVRQVSLWGQPLGLTAGRVLSLDDGGRSCRMSWHEGKDIPLDTHPPPPCLRPRPPQACNGQGLHSCIGTAHQLHFIIRQDPPGAVALFIV